MSITIPFPDFPLPEPTGDAELDVNRANTVAFISADPVVLALMPRTMTKTPGGGKKMEPGNPREEQVFRLIPQSDVQPSIQTPDGFQLTPTFVLLGTFDCEMERWDTFTLGGNSYQIVSTVRPEHTDARYESKADVARN